MAGITSVWATCRWRLRNAAARSIINQDEVQLHNFNARFQILKEGEFDQKWIPAVTAGVHYKYNDGISEINNELKETPVRTCWQCWRSSRQQTAWISRSTPPRCSRNCRARCWWNSAGARPRASGTDWADSPTVTSFVFEGNVVVFVTGNFALAAEYKQQPRDYTAIGSLVGKEGDWWTLDAAYVVNKHLTLAAGYGHFGNVLNNEANGVWGITTKWEF